MLLLEDVEIGTMRLKNRMAFPPITTGFGAVNGCFSDSDIAYVRERARGGAALVFADAVAVDRDHQLSVAPPLPYLDADEQVSSYARLADAIRNEGAKSCLQLYHAGRQTSAAKRGGRPPIAPSAISSTFLGLVPFPDAVEMSDREIEDTIQAFARAAGRAKLAGFDSVDIDGGAGYLIQQFMSPWTNKRTDAWGGSLENRMRFPLEVVSGVRKAVGEDYPLVFDLPMDEFVPGGLTREDGVNMALMLEEAGIDAFRVHCGLFETYSRIIPTMATPRGVNAPLGGMLKAKVKAKVLLGQRINEPELAERLLQEGACDLVLLGRALVADPRFPEKVRLGRSKEIRRCVACNTCVDQLMVGKPLRCAVNAQVGFEEEYRVRRAESRKSVLVAGGGPAGMEAARVAALRGHRVILCERSDALGGQVLLGSVPPHKEELLGLVDYLKGQMDALCVEVRLGSPVDRDCVQRLKPDTVIVATGALPRRPLIPGSDLGHVVLACDVLRCSGDIEGKKVVVVGGGSVGAEVAELLWRRGKEVTVLEMLDGIAQDMGLFVGLDFRTRMAGAPISFMTRATAEEIHPDAVTYIDETGARKRFAADTVVLALGYLSDRALVEAIRDLPLDVIVIGDAVSPRKIMDAIHEGFHAARGD